MVSPALPGQSRAVVDGARVVWQLDGEPPQAIQVQQGDNSIRLLAESDSGGGIVLRVEAQASFELEVNTGFTTFLEQVPAGCTRYLLTYLDRTDVRQL